MFNSIENLLSLWADVNDPTDKSWEIISPCIDNITDFMFL